jgi:nitrogen fixation protein NifB
MEDALRRHPCYSEDAHKKFARMHLPVAPGCNIQCNYCNRKYDCSNESRPGVTSELLAPQKAADKVAAVRAKIPELSVVAVAGPGDPLANEATFETLRLIRERFPDLILCVSTNGLALPENAQRLYDLGVRFLTVTMNAVNPETGSLIYASVIRDGKRYTGTEGAGILLRNQLEGIRLCVGLGMAVKVNIVMIPGINDGHIRDIVKTVRPLGVYIVNILPLIPVEGTAFSDRRAPTPEERKELLDICGLDVKMMRHCRQCRADAIGLLGKDRSREFVTVGSCKAGCGPSAENSVPPAYTVTDGTVVAVATSDGENIDRGFGNASRFDVYEVSGGEAKFLRKVDVDISRPVAGDPHREHIVDVAGLLSDCSVIVVKNIGKMPSKLLEKRGKTVRILSGAIGKDTFGL